MRRRGSLFRRLEIVLTVVLTDAVLFPHCHGYSKVARRKKREEAEKLPEVSKEMYYDVSGDLKAVFGTAKETVDEEKKMDKENNMDWDKEEEEEEEEPSQDTDEASALLSSFHSTNADAEKEESTGFKFSFFGDEAGADATPQEGSVVSFCFTY